MKVRGREGNYFKYYLFERLCEMSPKCRLLFIYRSGRTRMQSAVTPSGGDTSRCGEGFGHHLLPSTPRSDGLHHALQFPRYGATVDYPNGHNLWEHARRQGNRFWSRSVFGVSMCLFSWKMLGIWKIL